MKHRLDNDTMGVVQIPQGKYWGAQTQRSLNNFKIGVSGSMPKEIVHSYAQVKKAAAIVNAELGVLSEEKSTLIANVCDEIIAGKLDEHFPLVVWQTGSGTHTNMNCNEVISNRSHVILGGNLDEEKRFIHPIDDVNKSQSSNDTFPTAMHIAAYTKLISYLIPKIELLKETFALKSDSMMDIVKIGRTHWMDATPLTLGQEFSGYVSQLEHGLRGLRNTLPHLAELAIGGTAVGTGLNTVDGYKEKVVNKIAELTSLPFISAQNMFEALSANDAIVESHGALKQLAISLMKIANDLRFLASGPRSGIGEISLPFNEPGSSIMPGKVNPTQIEALTMVCAQVIGNDTTISIAGSNGHLELNVFKPVMIKAFLESATLLADASQSFNDNCLVGIVPNRVEINNKLQKSLMLVTALTPHIGYDNAAKIAQKAYVDNITIKEAAIELKILTGEQFELWVDPFKMTGLIK
nr:class II fumarate hydratase [uncultured Marinifilum sp.]